MVKEAVSYSYSDTSGSYSTETGSEVCEYDISYKFDDNLKLSADEIAKF